MINETIVLPQQQLTLSCSIQGSGPAVLFLHGAGESSAMWHDAVALLQNEFRCIVPDLPGHGQSQALPVSTISAYAEVILELIAVLKLPEVILCGHSMGGQISIVAGLRNPAVVSKLVLVNPAGLETFSEKEKAQLLQWADKTYSTPFAPELLRQFYGSHFPKNPEQLEAFLKHHLHPETDDVRRNKQQVNLASIKAMLHEPVFAFLPQLHVPTRIIYGKQDTLIPNRFLHPGTSTQLVMENGAAFIPAAETFPVEGCGHYLPVEAPEVFAASFREAVKQ